MRMVIISGVMCHAYVTLYVIRGARGVWYAVCKCGVGVLHTFATQEVHSEDALFSKASSLKHGIKSYPTPTQLGTHLVTYT